MMIEMFGFELVFRHPERLWWILLACGVIGGFLVWDYATSRYSARHNPILRLHGIDALPRVRTYLFRGLGSILLAALLVAAWAEPEQRLRMMDLVYGNVRIALLLDVSLSMRYAQDVEPYPDRLEAMKDTLNDFATMTANDPELQGAYYRAIIPFAGAANVYMPFSADLNQFIDTLGFIDETSIQRAGSDLLAPFVEYERMLKRYPLESDDTVDIVVLISDGGKEEFAYEDVSFIDQILRRLPHVAVYTVGVGSVSVRTLPNGTQIRKSDPVPLIKRNRDGSFVDYVRVDEKDPQSSPMHSELDERTLERVAGTRGRYFHYTGKEALLQELKDVILENRTVKEIVELPPRFLPVVWWFLLFAFVIACYLFGYFHNAVFFLASAWKRAPKASQH